MGVFTRFRDIVSSNLNSILDRAEDPEKMVRLMIIEMEETLGEIKSQCAGVIAEQKKIERELAGAVANAADWEEKARLAVRKGREELARAAVIEKRRWSDREVALREELDRVASTVVSFREDIGQLEAKLQDARDKQRSIVQRKVAAEARHQVRSAVRRVDTAEAFMKFEAYENNIERMEADADTVDSMRPRPKKTLADEFDELKDEVHIEGELDRIRREVQSEKRTATGEAGA